MNIDNKWHEMLVILNHHDDTHGKWKQVQVQLMNGVLMVGPPIDIY